MSHGLPQGVVRLYDEEGNPVTVSVQPTGQYAVAVVDERLLREVERLRKALGPEELDPWQVPGSPWEGMR